MFSKLKFELDRFQYLDYIENHINKNSLWQYSYGVALFRLSETEPKFINDNPYLKAIAEKFNSWKIFLYKMPGRTFLPWHVDTQFRIAGVNSLLNNFESSSVFYNVTPPGQYELSFAEVKYEPNAVYALDVSIPHTVFNFAESNRYLLTCIIDSSVNYLDIVEFCENEF